MNIRIRPITTKDTELIVKWRNSEKVRNHCFSKSKITEDSHINFFKQNIKNNKYRQFIVERIDADFGLASYPIATVYLKDLDMENKRCELCIFTSDDIEWDADGQSSAIQMLLQIAFNDLKMHKVYSYVFSEYMNEVDLLKNSGFSIEAILKNEAIGSAGDYVDVVRMSVFNPELDKN